MGDNGAASGDTTGKEVRIVLLHHSTGECIWNGGVPQWFEAYNAARGTRYVITEQAFPKDSPYGWENYPYDYWNIWVRNAGDKPFKQEPTLEMLSKKYDLVVLKHCFPVSNIDADTGEADVASSDKRLENYRLQYDALKKKMHEFPKVKFLVWTGAAQVAGDTDAEQAGRARQFAAWVRDTWDTKGDNIFVWDFRTLETDGGLYIKPGNASGDAHPNEEFSRKAAPLLAQRIVDVIEGRGDTGDVCGGKLGQVAMPKPDATTDSQPTPAPVPPPPHPDTPPPSTGTKMTEPVKPDAAAAGAWVFEDGENAEAAKRLWPAAAGRVEDNGANVIAVNFAKGREEDWGEYGVQRLVETRPPEKNVDVSAYRYMAMHVKTDRNMELVVHLVTRPDPAGPADQSQFAFAAYLHPEAGDWKTYAVDLTKMELGAEGDAAYAAAGKPTRPMHLTLLRLVTNKKNEAAKVMLDDITFYRDLPADLQGCLVAP
ncbi:MAG: hypothetical protein JXL80_03185 [Planctomycetes bacterium]|nr:hypothetical protein [Planctomycetota bacterium]